MQNLKQQTDTQHFNTQAFNTETIAFKALDDYPLVGTLYTPKNFIKAQIVLACATGVPQGFYRRFSEYAAQLGYQVFTFDYRGVSQSAPKTLKGFSHVLFGLGEIRLSRCN